MVSLFRAALVFLSLTLASPTAEARCAGENLLPDLSQVERATIDAAIEATPYAKGNAWRATKGGAVIEIVGTYHMDDPRFDAIIDRLSPRILSAKTVLVEAGPEELAAIKSAMAKNPGLLFSTDGPTLPERLEEQEWQRLSEEVQARGIPAILASKMKPWYVSTFLSLPPCAVQQTFSDPNGIDTRVITLAQDAGIPIRALEPYDTLFSVFGSMSEEEEIQMIRSALATSDQAEDLITTAFETYLNEEVRTIWELSRVTAYAAGIMDKSEIDAYFDKSEEAINFGRNRAWIPVIEAAAAEGPVFVAFGALHLSGQDGVLALLERAGYEVERQPF